MISCIKLESVSKLYKLYEKPSDRLKELIGLGKRHREFWALRDVNLEIFCGESVGIIGLNGAGKSTLLQIIAGTLKPTTGRVMTKGRISALLELGIGFHHEFTGRENIRMASSLMGIPWSQELEKKVIDFAEIGEFIDQPVKTYSSGMFVRLAFSLAICVEPDILIIDEALSVGDYYFQKKSFDKILEFREKGKTLVFCSHSLYHINHLCSRAVWIHNGKIKMDGPANIVTLEYEQWIEKQKKEAETKKKKQELKGSKGKIDLKLSNSYGETDTFETGEKFSAEIKYSSPFDKSHIAIGLSKNLNLIIFATSTQLEGLGPIAPKGTITWEIEKLPLLPGNYEFSAVLLDESGNVVIDRKLKEFKVKHKNPLIERIYGIVKLNGKWNFQG